MARKFILIDQSVKAPGGHHYEYDQRILDAARAQGFETLLLAHESYRATSNHPVRSTFSLTFWDNYRYYYSGSTRSELPAFLLPLARTYRRLGALRLDLKRRLVFSRFGLAMGRARHVFFRDILLRPYLPDEASLTPTGRPLLALSRLVILLTVLFGKLRPTLSRIRRKRLLRWAALLVLSPLLAPAWIVLRARATRRDPPARFARELVRALGGETISADTIVFVPNATAAELNGLIAVAGTGHAAARAHWAFLYRRPVFSGYPASYRRQLDKAQFQRVELARVKTLAPGVDVRFYTDTDELTAQYELLGVYPFSTLPVPVDAPAEVPPPTERVLTIGYLGDARDEKGFQHLPRLVEAFAPRPDERARVRFLFQANFNVPQGEPGSRYARSLLEQHDGDLIELVHGPFDSAEYNALLRRMDIVLIPYAAESYSARSSGVLMEALSAGKPVLIPCASWMAGVVEPARRRHLQSLFATRAPIAQLTAPFERLNDKTLLIDERADHILLRLTFEDAFDGYVRVVVRSINEFDCPLRTSQMVFRAVDGEVIAVMPKPRSSRLWLKVVPIDAEFSARRVDMEICLYEIGTPLPLGAGAALFDRPQDIPGAVRELVDFHSHHRRAATALREELEPLYEPGALVEKLARDAFGKPAPRTAERLRAVG